MQIQLKQHEITEAIKIYLVSKGLNLTGKQVTAEFSMTRKPTQVSAEVIIAEVAIPGYTDAEEDAQPVTVKEVVQLASVTTLPKKAEPEAAPASAEASPEPAAEPKADEPVEVDPPTIESDAPKRTSSLFSAQ